MSPEKYTLLNSKQRSISEKHNYGMKFDVQGLRITDQEFEQISGIQALRNDWEQIIDLYRLFDKSPEVFAQLPIANLVIRPSTLENAEFRSQLFQRVYQKNWENTGWLGKGLNKFTRTIEKKIEAYLRLVRPTPVGILVDEVDQFNRVIEEITFVDHLQEVGNPVSIRNRDDILMTLQHIRAELVRAVKTERLFRENPQFARQDFSLDLISWQRLELDEQAQKYEQFVNEALEIGLRVREDLKTWYLVEERSKTTL